MMMVMMVPAIRDGTNGVCVIDGLLL